MSISWGHRERYRFIKGGAMSGWTPPAVAAVYSITYKQDPRNKPKSHTVLYFGEASDLSQELPSVDEVLHNWVDESIGADDLYVFFHQMPGSTKFERSRVQQSLVGDYRPRGNGF
ncbi:MAG TPA: hypothetical protein V6D17_04785 [Candidatus Obscuribacterales bacterium]